MKLNYRLRGWYNTIGQKEEIKQLSKSAGGDMNAPWLTIQETKDLQYGQPGAPNTYMAKVNVSLVRAANCLYKSCPNEGCKKKV